MARLLLEQVKVYYVRLVRLCCYSPGIGLYKSLIILYITCKPGYLPLYETDCSEMKAIVNDLLY